MDKASKEIFLLLKIFNKYAPELMKRHCFLQAHKVM